MRVHFRVTSPLLAFILILIGITRGWALIPMIGLVVLALILITIAVVGYTATHPRQVATALVEDHNRTYSDYLVVDVNTKQIIRRYSSIHDLKRELYGTTITNGHDADGKTIRRHCHFMGDFDWTDSTHTAHRGFKHFDCILYKEYDYRKEMNK